MANPVYPASNNAEAIALNISNANQFFTVLQGSIDDFIPTYEGNGEIPSVAKALNEAAAYRVPLPWETVGEATDLMQPYEYNGNVYVPRKVPALFSTAPDTEYWRLYSEKTAQILIDNVTFTGDGTTTDFSIPSAVVDDPAAYFVTVDGVTQRPTIDYSVNVGTDTLSFTEAPPATSANNISVTILGALKGALSEGIYETVAGGLAETVDGGFFNVVNTSDPEAFIDLYKNNGGSALLIDTYPNSLAYNNLASDVQQNADDIQNRTIYVGSVAELEGLSLPVGTAVYLTEEGRAGEFVVKSGVPPSDPQKGVYIVLANGNYAERINKLVMSPEMYGAVGDGVADDTLALQAFGASDCAFGISPNGKTYLATAQVDFTKPKAYNLNGSTWDFQFTSQQAGIYVKSDDVEIFGGSVLVAGSGGAETGGNGHTLNCITSGVQSDGSGWSGLHVHHLFVTTNRTDAGAHIGIIGECTNFHIHDIEVPDNAVCRNIIGCEWGGTPVGGTGHPHNGKIENIKIGNITTPTFGGAGYAYAVWLSAAFNIHVQNVTMETGYGLLMAIRGDNANTYAPARYKALVGTGITFDNLAINSFYGYAVRVIGSNRSATLDNIPMSVKGSNLTAIGGKVGANNNFGLGLEQCKDVSIRGVNISGSTSGGVTTGTAVDNLDLEFGEIVDCELYGAQVGSSGEPTRAAMIKGITFKRNNSNGGGLAGTAAVVLTNSEGCRVEGCTFGEEGETETQKYSISVTADTDRAWLQNNYTWGLAASGVAYHNPSSTDASGFNNFAAAGLTATSGTWVAPVATA